MLEISSVRKSFFQSFLLLVMSGIAALAIHTVRPPGLPWIGNWSPAVVAGIYLKGLSEVTADQILSLEQEGLLVFLDPRDPLLYSADPWPDSINLPPRDVPSMLVELTALAGAGMEFVILCDGGRCTRGAELARVLKAKGFHSFRIFRNQGNGRPKNLDGGFPPGRTKS